MSTIDHHNRRRSRLLLGNLKHDGPRLRRFREKHGLTREQVAARIGMHWKAVYRAERPDSTTPAETIDRIALALNVPVVALIEPCQIELLVESLDRMGLLSPSIRPDETDFSVDATTDGWVLRGTVTCRRRNALDEQPTA